jgi:hypothetical protein
MIMNKKFRCKKCHLDLDMNNLGNIKIPKKFWCSDCLQGYEITGKTLRSIHKIRQEYPNKWVDKIRTSEEAEEALEKVEFQEQDLEDTKRVMTKQKSEIFRLRDELDLEKGKSWIRKLREIFT